MKDRIQRLLGSGLSPSLVSSVVGCDISYISQLLSDPSFAAAVADLRAKDIESLQKRDGKYDQLEDAFLDRLENLLPMMLKPRDVLSALQVINAARRRSLDLVKPLGADQSLSFNANTVVVLQLPAKTVSSFELNQKNEIISIDSQALVAMPTASLLSSIRAEEAAKTPLKEISNELSSLQEAEDSERSKEIEKRIISEDSI